MCVFLRSIQVTLLPLAVHLRTCLLSPFADWLFRTLSLHQDLLQAGTQAHLSPSLQAQE